MEQRVAGSLTKEEQEQLAPLLARVTPLPKMEWPVLRTIWERRLLPMNPMELVVLDKSVLSESGPEKVLLSYRDDAHFLDCWHHPGGYLGGSEKIVDATQRVADREFQVKLNECYVVQPINSYKLARDHELAVVFVATMDNSTLKLEKGKLEFFPFDQLPANLLPHHRLIQERAVDWLRVMQELNPKHREMVLRVTRYLESDLLI